MLYRQSNTALHMLGKHSTNMSYSPSHKTDFVRLKKKIRDKPHSIWDSLGMMDGIRKKGNKHANVSSKQLCFAHAAVGRQEEACQE